MINKRCRRENCPTRPSFGKPGTNAREYCSTHAPIDYVDVKNKRCRRENCSTRPYFFRAFRETTGSTNSHSSPDYIDIFQLVADGKLEEVIKYLDKSENRNVVDEIGRSLLIVAIDRNKGEIIDLLLKENKKLLKHLSRTSLVLKIP